MKTQVKIAWPPLTPGVKILLIAYAVVFAIDPLFSGSMGTRQFISDWFYLSAEGALGGLKLWQPLTYQFFHGDFFHLLFNGMVLYMFGSDAENRWSTKHFLGFVIGCGVFAGLVVLGWNVAHAAIMGQPLLSELKTVGASGAINAIIAAYALHHWDKPLRFFLIPKPIKGKWILAFILALDLFQGLVNSEVSVAAHLGGLAIGMLVCSGYYKPERLMQRYKLWRFRRKVKTLGGGRGGGGRNTTLH